MSSIVIAGDTSGSVTLQAPAVAGTVTVTLPATSGTLSTSASQWTTTGSDIYYNTGNVGIGTSSPTQKLDVNTTAGEVIAASSDRSTNGQYISGLIQTAKNSSSAYVSYAAVYGSITSNTAGSESGALTLWTRSGGTITERARLDSSGNLLVGTTSASGRARIVQSNNDKVLTVENTAASPSATSTLLYINQSVSTQTPPAIQYYSGAFGGAICFQVLGSGNVQNTNNSYGAISDIKLKENIVDATPKLEKLQQVRIVNYNLIGQEQKQIGVIAQELEQVFPSMVDEQVDHDAKGNDLGTTTKSVKYSVFVPMLIKAMQEQQEIIESLKARLDAANL
jgi:hypothetical protein